MSNHSDVPIPISWPILEDEECCIKIEPSNGYIGKCNVELNLFVAISSLAFIIIIFMAHGNCNKEVDQEVAHTRLAG